MLRGKSDSKKKPSRSEFKLLRIAQLAPLYERVPPKLYGGTERVVSYLTDELVRRGHDVTLFASGDSITKARLHAGHPESLRLAGIPEHGVFLHFPMISDAFKAAAKTFDVIHGHIDYWSFPFAQMSKIPSVSTLHGRLDIDALRPLYSRYRKMPVVSISDAQRPPLPFMNWKATVYHGLPRDLLSYSAGPGKYLAFLGRISPEKRPDLAIDVAQKVGLPLKIAAKVDVVDKAYFEAVVKPRLSPPDVEYIGEINEVEKDDFLGHAIALLFTIDRAAGGARGRPNWPRAEQNTSNELKGAGSRVRNDYQRPPPGRPPKPPRLLPEDSFGVEISTLICRPSSSRPFRRATAWFACSPEDISSLKQYTR